MANERQRRRFSSCGKFAAILAIVLLGSAATFCQTGATDKSSPGQSTSASQEKTPEKAQDSAPNKDQDKKETKSSSPTITKLRIMVTANDKPVGNASVYVKYNETGGLFHREKLAEMNFKTNEDGSVKVPEVPRGKILIQVIAKGWHTYGKWYDIETDGETIQIKLEEPHHWY
jgi:hypothetical protein